MSWKNRKSSNNYWQQEVAYSIKANINETNLTVSGGLELVYTNNSPDELKEVFFHLYQNAFQKGAYYDNLQKNNVEGKCTIIEGDNRKTTDHLENIADRVLLGLLPTAEDSYHVALKCIKEEGGILHIHGLSPSNNHEKFILETSEKLQKINYNYTMTNCKINKIKSYAPHWDHLVLDIQLEKT